ncbi:MAG: hypothetical protein GX979_01810, partial [Firmicutes bacterium]|nr:hypothetical protein [Bacillota bacterium]
NSMHGGRYLFAGQYTQTKPFAEDQEHDGPGLPGIEFLPGLKDGDGNPIHPDENDMSIEFEIGTGVKMGVNIDARKILVGDPNDSDDFGGVFGVLQRLHTELSAPSPVSSSTVLGDLDKALDNVLQQVSELGGKQNRVGLAKERMLDLKLNLTKILSEDQDLDYAEAIMELKMEEFAYRTALSVGARIIQPTLVDFLR